MRRLYIYYRLGSSLDILTEPYYQISILHKYSDIISTVIDPTTAEELIVREDFTIP